MITITPSNPSSDDYVVVQIVSSGCVESTSRVQNGSQLLFTTNLSDNCYATPPGYNKSWVVGRLPAGNYTFIHNHYDGVADTTTTISSDAFSVTTGTFPFDAAAANIPFVPTIPVVGLVMLAVALGYLAIRKFKISA